MILTAAPVKSYSIILIVKNQMHNGVLSKNKSHW